MKPFPVFRGVFLQSLCVSCCRQLVNQGPVLAGLEVYDFVFSEPFFFGGGWGGGAEEDLLPNIVLGVEVVKF